MINWLRAQAWKVGAVGAGGAALLLGGCLIATSIELHQVEKRRDALHDEIHNEATGYVVRLATLRGNVAALDQGLSRQSESIYRLGAESATKLAAAEQAIAAAEGRLTKAQTSATKLLAPAKGADDCERFRDIDRRLLETLK